MKKRFYLIICFLMLLTVLVSCSENENNKIPSDLITLTVDTTEYIESGIIKLNFTDNTYDNITADNNYIHYADSMHIYKLTNGMWQYAVSQKISSDNSDREIRFLYSASNYENRKMTISLDLNSESFDYDFSAGTYLIVQEGKFSDTNITNTVQAVFELPEK